MVSRDVFFERLQQLIGALSFSSPVQREQNV